MEFVNAKLEYLAQLKQIMESPTMTGDTMSEVWERIKAVCDSIDIDLLGVTEVK